MNRRDEDGNLIVYETFASRILGLFNRRKLVGHDPDLRAKRVILGDLVDHRIPDHARKVDDNHWTFQTRGTVVNDSPHAAAAYDYRSPANMSFRESEQMRERINKMQVRMERKDAELAETQQEITRLRRKIQSDSQMTREQILEEIQELMETVQAPQNAHYQLSRKNGSKRHPEDQSEVSRSEADD